MSRILRFFVCLGTLFFAGNALAAGYSCSSLPTYLSCQHGYYMTANKSSTTHNGTPRVGNYCQPCSRMGSNYTCAGGTAAPVQSAGGYTCPTYMKYTSCAVGYYMTSNSTSTAPDGTPKVRNACRPCSVYGANYTCAGGTAAPQAITINVTCPAGQYLPQGATSCTTCPAGSYCPGNEKFTGISLVTGATSDRGKTSCSSATSYYFESAAGSSNINDCYLTLADDESVEIVNGGTDYCHAGYYCGNGGRKIYYDSNNEERGLTDSRPTVAPSTACARGSYSDDQASSCDACLEGATTSGTGLDYCDAECSNSANVKTWVTPTWTPNYVSNLCKIDSCVACTKGTGVASCSASIVNNTCTYTATCASGYKNPTCNGSSCSCELDSVTCSAGQYLPAGATSCATCPKGYKCPSSKTYTVSTTADQGNTPCSGSTEYQDATGQTSCKTPSDGYYKKDNTSQQVCGTGYFCKSGVRTACTTYGTGYTTDTTTASVNTQCYLNVAGGKVRNGTTGTTLNTCGVGKFKRPHQAYYGTSYSCDSCPAAESGWTMGTDTGLTNYTACYETKAATSISNYCSAGQLKKNATSTTTWGTATISTAFQAKGGSIVKGQTCEQCGAGTYSAGGTATSCSTCDTAYPYSDAGTSSAGSCYKNGTKTGSQLNGSTPTNCYSVTSWNSCTPGTCTYRIYKSGTTTSCTPTNCTKTPAAVTAKSGHRTDGTSCTACPSGYPNSADGNSGGVTACYSNSKSRAWTGSQVNGSTPTNCYSVTSWNACSLPACSYVAYSNSSGNGDGTIKSGCSTNSANCTKTPAAVTAKSGHRTDGTSCTACPSGYPNSADGNSGGVTACYSNSKSRAWTGSQVNGSTPTNCYSVTSWNACSLPACSYVAYSNSSGNGDGAIKSGCSTNSANCTKTPAAVTAKSGHYVSGTSCTPCSELAGGRYPNSDNGNTGGASACRTDSLSGQVIATPNASSTTQCVAGTYKAAHTVNYGGTSSCGVCGNNQFSDAGAASCTGCKTANGYTNSGTTAESHAGVASCKATCAAGTYVATAGSACTTVGTGYWGAGGTVSQNTTLDRNQCPEKYRDGAAATQKSDCAVQTTAGKYIATAKATEQTKCPAKNYCPSASVKYGATNSPTACPTADATTARTTYPDDYLNPTRLSINNQGWSTGLPAITSCSANYSFTNAAGNFSVESVGYNATTGKYENGGGKYYTFVNAGWYLVDKYSDTYCNEPTNRMLYHNVAECTANSYCPGYNSMPLCSTGTHNDEMGRFACSNLGNGYNYSPAKSGATTACYLTTTAGKYVAASKAAESACKADGWCPGGVRVNYGSTGGRNTCPTKYPSSAASSNSELDCYVTTAAGKYVATVGAGQVNCAGTGYYCPGGTNVYSGAYGSRLTTGGRTQCPAGYRDLVATASTTKEAQCTMNVAGGKYVKVAKESAASGTCVAGYAKAAHSVTYGNTSSCAACTGATYAASTGQATCTTCPTAKTYASAVKSYDYWNTGKDGDHTISDGCYATMTGTLSNGSLTEHGCYLGTDGDYGNGGGKRCYVHQDNLKCNAGYYASTLSNGYVWNNTRAGLLGNTCVGVGAGYYSAANILTRNQCPTGLTTIGYGAGADEVTDCGRILHFGNDKLYLRSGKKTTPSLNVKIGDTTYYGNMTAGTGKGKLRLKSGTTTYSVHDDSM